MILASDNIVALTTLLILELESIEKEFICFMRTSESDIMLLSCLTLESERIVEEFDFFILVFERILVTLLRGIIIGIGIPITLYCIRIFRTKFYLKLTCYIAIYVGRPYSSRCSAVKI